MGVFLKNLQKPMLILQKKSSNSIMQSSSHEKAQSSCPEPNAQPETEDITDKNESVGNEINDVEPVEESESDSNIDLKKTIDPTKLLASGVSITVIDKKKKDESNNDASKDESPSDTIPNDMELSSDISVT